MENKSSDTEFVSGSMSSSMSSSTSNSTEHLQAPTGPKSKVWKYFGFATDEAGMIVNNTSESL